jgi:general secretion pathway protein K
MRRPDDGVILINVLVILALTAAIVFAMIRLSDVAILRSQRFSDAGQGLALIAAGEASVMAALRRDDPAKDHKREEWATVGQNDVAIEGGRFALVVEDAQARFNLNALASSGALGVQVLDRIVQSLDLPQDVTTRIVARLAQGGPLQNLDDLVVAGLSPADVAALKGLVTLLPGATEMNINTVPDALIGVITDNPVQARVLIGIRRRNGFLTVDDMVTAGVILPAGVGYRSGLFWVTTTVTMGDVVQVRWSLLQRGQAGVRVIGRGVPDVTAATRAAQE